MQFDFKSIDRIDFIDKQGFIENYYKPQKPVVIKNITQD